METLKKDDPELYEFIRAETLRQQTTLELIPSENSVPQIILEATSTILTNKYAEGIPGKRYYGGCEFVDKIEQLAIDRAKKLFNAEFANVQPHSGTQANMAVYFSFLKPNDTIMGMDLTCGGHLTHGAKVNFSGFLYNVVAYGVSKSTGRIDFNEVRELAKKHRPKMIIAGASSYPRIIEFEKFSEIAKEVGAYLMVDMAHIAGLVASGVHPSPVSVSDFVTSTTHKTLRGPRGGFILSKENYGKDINSRVCPGIQGGPLLHVISAKAVCFKLAMTEDFKEYQKKIVSNAKTLAQTLMDEGLILTTGGTENHLMVVDLTNLSQTGKEAQEKLDMAGLTVNKNTIPYDTAKPLITSGIRLGTPSVTTRGMGENEMKWLGKTLVKVLKTKDAEAIQKIRHEVSEVCRQFPLYKNL